MNQQTDELEQIEVSTKPVACKACENLGHFCPAALDLDTDEPACRACDLGIKCPHEARKQKTAPVANGRPHGEPTAPLAPQPQKPKRKVRDVAKERKPPVVTKSVPRDRILTKDASRVYAKYSYSREIMTEAQYSARYKSRQWADPSIVELLKAAIAQLKPGQFMVVHPQKGQVIERLRNKIFRTMKNYFPREDRLLISQHTRLKHVVLKKLKTKKEK